MKSYPVLPYNQPRVRTGLVFIFHRTTGYWVHSELGLVSNDEIITVPFASRNAPDNHQVARATNCISCHAQEDLVEKEKNLRVYRV